MRGFILAMMAGQGLATQYANVTFVEQLKWTYDDHGTGAKMDMTVYTPQPSDTTTQFVVGSVAVQGYDNYNTTIAVMDSPVGLADPTNFTWIWNDEKTKGKHEVTFARPVCPEGFSSVSDFALPGHCYGSDCLDAFKQQQASLKITIKPCINDTMLLNCSQDLAPLVWNDHKSHGKHDTSVFALVGPPGDTVNGYGAAANIGNMQGFWRATQGYPSTLGGVYKCLDPNFFIESVWSSTAEWGAGVNGEQTFVTGTSYTSSDSLSEEEESSLCGSLSESISAGFYGVKVTDTATMTANYTQSTSEELATAASESVTVTCKAPNCSQYNYTTNELRIYQWGLNAKKVDGTDYYGGIAQVTTCQFFCGSNYVYPRCPPASCSDDSCQTCCTSNGFMVPCYNVDFDSGTETETTASKPKSRLLGKGHPRESVVFGVHASSRLNAP